MNNEMILNYTEPLEYSIVRKELSRVNFQDNRLKDCQKKEIYSQAVRVIHRGAVGAVRSDGFETLDVLIERAKRLSGFTRPVAFDFPEGDGKLHTFQAVLGNAREIELPELVEMGEYIVQYLEKRLGEWSVHLELDTGTCSREICNSRGSHFRTSYRFFEFGVTLVNASDSDIIELFDGRSRHFDSGLEDFLDGMVETAKRTGSVASLDPGKYPLLLYPTALDSFLEALRIGVNGKNIFENTSPLKNKMHTRIFDSRITLRDDPLDKRSMGYAPVSDEGVPSLPRKIIDNGVFKNLLADLDYGCRLGSESRNHGWKLQSMSGSDSLAANPFIAPSNWIIEPGTVSFEDMLKSIEKGVLLMNTWDVWSGDLTNGVVSGTTHLGFLVEHGSIMGRIKNMRVSGNIYDLLGKQLEAVSLERPETSVSDLTAPFLLIKDVSVA